MQVPRGSSTMVEHKPHHPKVKGSSLKVPEAVFLALCDPSMNELWAT